MNVLESYESKENAYEYLRSVNVGDQLKWILTFLFDIKEELETNPNKSLESSKYIKNGRK